MLLNVSKELSFANSSRDVWHNGNNVEKTRNYRHFPHIMSISFLFVHLSLLFSFCCKDILRMQFLFLRYGDLTSRTRYSIDPAVVNLIEHKGFRYSSSAICNRMTYPIKSSYAIDYTPTQRQTLDKFYSLLLHSCIVISSCVVVLLFWI